MNVTKHVSRLGALLAVPGGTAAAFAGAATASTTMIPLHGGTDGSDAVASQQPVTRTVVAALAVPVAAVLADRARAARRRPLSRPA